jgi:hypothetical protein
MKKGGVIPSFFLFLQPVTDFACVEKNCNHIDETQYVDDVHGHGCFP